MCRKFGTYIAVFYGTSTSANDTSQYLSSTYKTKTNHKRAYNKRYCYNIATQLKYQTSSK